jgi:DNA-binding response OmpR family regulator
MDRRALIILDSTDASERVAVQLGRLGLATIATVDGYVGLVRALEGSFDLIVADSRMPLIDGDGLVATLRQEAVLTPVLILNQEDGADHSLDLPTAGPVSRLAEPFSDDELAGRARELLDQGGPSVGQN